MRYAGIIENDIAAAPGVCVSFFTQGCNNHCFNCHNPETWDPHGGKQFTQATLDQLLKAINANGIKRNLCIMGGEPLLECNLFLTNLIIAEVRKHYPDIKIYLWTGYLYENLQMQSNGNEHLKYILNNIDVLIDGPYVDNLRDITLFMRGSSNQRIIELNK